MEHYVGHSGRKIVWVGPKPEGPSVLLPADLVRVPPRTLMSDYEVRDGVVTKPLGFSDPSKLRAAFISVYRIPCGISTYSEWLWPELGKRFHDYRIFAEQAEAAPEDKVVRCWKRGESLAGLLEQVRAFNPDVVYVQHEWGIFPNARFWLAMIAGLQAFRTVVTMHSVYPVSGDAHLDKLVCESAIREVTVHTQIQREALLTKGVSAKIHVIPHGCLPPTKEPRLFNLYRSKHTVFQFGFGFRYKGWSQALEVVSRLRQGFPDVFFTGLFSVPANAGPEVGALFEELQGLVHQMKLEDHVALIQGYQPESALRAYLRMNKVALFPYIPNGEHTVLGCSGAARFTMAHEIPVVVSNVPLFSDLEGVCPRAGSVDKMAEAIAALFDPKAARLQVEKQNKCLLQNSWKISADRYVQALQT